MRTRRRWLVSVALALALAAGACTSSGTSDDGSSSPPDKEEDTGGGTEQARAPFAVGVRTETFVDDSRPTDATPGFNGAPDRTLPTTIYYPAADGEPGAAPVDNADPAMGPFPFVLFSHGVNSLGTDYEALLTQWVEAGFVVAAPNYPLGSSDAPGATPVVTDAAQQAVDASFVTDEVLALDGVGAAIDPERIAAVGHSLGAITTSGFALSNDYGDDRVSAAIQFAAPPGFEGGVTYGIPLLLIHGDADGSVPYELTATNFAEVPAPSFFVTLLGAEHTEAFRGGDLPAADVVAATTLDFLSGYLDDDPDAVDRIVVDGDVPGVSTVDAHT